jgi:hypothetical protein
MSTVVLVEQNDDRIVLVEQMWTYKKDFTRFLGIMHGFVVTTTLKGKKTKRDIILDPKKKVSVRVLDYDPNRYESNIWTRFKVPPELTEDQLQSMLNELSTQYDITDNNCWHYSHNILKYFKAQPKPHPYLYILSGTQSFLSYFISNQTLKLINRSISEMLTRI